MKNTMTDETWMQLLTLELRGRRVRGSAIGDAIASARELLRDSGQGAEETFGSARNYAASLDLPIMSDRDQSLKTAFLPVLGIFAFLIFAWASNSWFSQAPILLSIPQSLLLAVPILLTVICSTLLYPRAATRQRWLPAFLLLAAGVTGALASVFAPTSAADAWQILSALPVLAGTMTVLIALSVLGTIVTFRSGDGEEIIEPWKNQANPARRTKRRALLILVDWLFPILAIAIFVMTWGVSFLRA